MATINVTKDLEVLDHYIKLLNESLGTNSVYIRTRETLEDMFLASDFTSREKADILSNVLGSLNTALVNTSMSTALQWAANEKDVELKKLELAQQLDILAQEALLKTAQVSKMQNDDIATQAQTIRMYGTPTVVDGTVVSLNDTGKLYEDILLTQQGVINAGKEGLLLDGKKQESEAAIHKVVADTYRNYGSYTYLLDDAGLTGVTPTHGVYETLSDHQEEIAKQQANGYAYNAWANALTGSASMLGTALASDLVDFAVGSTETQLLDKVLASATKLDAAVKAY